MFCLTRCASKSPKILTCLHSACEDCFQERLEAASKENKGVTVDLDEDGCPIAAEITVSCPLCKVASSEREIVDNLFLTASEEPGVDDELPETHMCSVSCTTVLPRE